MSDFTLPSGRVVTFTKERPTWGDMMDANDAGVAAEKQDRSATPARALVLMARLTDTSESDLRALAPEDGNALAIECFRRAKPRSDDEQVPS